MQIDEGKQDKIPDREAQSTWQRRRRQLFVVIIIGVVLGGSLAVGLLPRLKQSSTVRAETAQMAVPTVSVVHPARAAPKQEIVLPANVQAYISAPIYARTNGYLKQWYVDIGGHVKKGQLLAVIETPELDQQLQQARGTLATAQANLSLSDITAKRYTDLVKDSAVTQQATDNAVWGLQANKATVQAYQANVRQLEELQSYEKVYAPFDGVISQRNTDIGALITAGSTAGTGSTQTELFHIVQPDILRVYVNVPEGYSQQARPGLAAELALAEFPGRTFTGKLVRTADAIDPITRTLMVEIQVKNTTGTLFTGSYAEVHLKLQSPHDVYLVPVETLLFRSTGLHVAAVTNGQVLIKTITPGHDFGDHIEVVAGLNGDETVIVNPSDSIATGNKVNVATQSGAQTVPAAGGAK